MTDAHCGKATFLENAFGIPSSTYRNEIFHHDEKGRKRLLQKWLVKLRCAWSNCKLPANLAKLRRAHWGLRRFTGNTKSITRPSLKR